MRVAGRHAAAVVDAGVVAVPTGPARQHDRPCSSRLDRSAVRDADIDARV